MNKSAASRRFDKESTQNLNNKEIFYGKLLFLFSDENIVLPGQYIPLYNKIILQTSDVPFLYPQKTSIKPEVFCCFQGVYKWNIGLKPPNLVHDFLFTICRQNYTLNS